MSPLKGKGCTEYQSEHIDIEMRLDHLARLGRAMLVPLLFLCPQRKQQCRKGIDGLGINTSQQSPRLGPGNIFAKKLETFALLNSIN